MVPITLFTPSEGKNKRGNGRMKGGKTRIYKEFLDIFCQDSRKKSKKTGVERRGICAVPTIQNMVQAETTT